MLIDDLREGVNDLKDMMECDFKQVTSEQKDILWENFNKAFNFMYCEDGGYLFVMPSKNFNSFEHYMGMEYERGYIEGRIELNGAILVAYEYGCERAKELIELLEEKITYGIGEVK